jgi:hypothetical protein
MNWFRILVGGLLFAIVWGWYRAREAVQAYTGSGSIADASTRSGGFLDTQLRTELGNVQTDWLDSQLREKLETASNYQQVNGYCDPVGSTGIAFTNGQEYNVTCTRQGFNSYGTWMLGSVYSGTSQQYDRDQATHDTATTSGTQFDR